MRLRRRRKGGTGVRGVMRSDGAGEMGRSVYEKMAMYLQGKVLVVNSMVGTQGVS